MMMLSMPLVPWFFQCRALVTPCMYNPQVCAGVDAMAWMGNQLCAVPSSHTGPALIQHASVWSSWDDGVGAMA
jgi:hypothetical protein